MVNKSDVKEYIRIKEYLSADNPVYAIVQNQEVTKFQIDFTSFLGLDVITICFIRLLKT